MSFAGVPHSISIVFFITQYFGRLSSVFQSYSDDHQLFSSLMASDDPFDENSDFLTSESLVIWTQLIVLATVSMFGGMVSSSIRSVTSADERMTLVWDDNVVVHMTMGRLDGESTYFLSQCMGRLFSKPQGRYSIDRELIVDCYHLLEGYCQYLQSSMDKLSTLVTHKDRFRHKQFAQDEGDLFFILLTCLPEDQLNALYLHIQQFFPDRLLVELPGSGHKIDLKSFLQMPASDIDFMIEKIKMHYNLYFHSELEHVRDEIQSETNKYLQKILQNTATLDYTVTQLTQVRDEYLGLLNRFFTFFVDQLRAEVER